MATSKKTTAKKTTRTTKTAPKAAVTKKTAAKPAPKKAVAKKTTAKKATSKQAEVKSFRVAKNEGSFTDFRITRQTVYWIILIAFIIFAQLWILKLQIEVAGLIDAQAAELQQY